MRNSLRIVIVFIFFSLASAFTLTRLNVDLLPKDSGNILNVSFTTTNSTPEETEQQATTIIENALSKLRNLKSISSASNERGGSIRLVFDKNENLANKQIEINALLRQIKLEIPSIVSLFLEKNDGSSDKSPLLLYSFHAEGNIDFVKQQAQDLLKREISSIQGVKLVDITGVSGQQITVTYDLDKLFFYSLEVPTLLKAINQLSDYTYQATVRNDQSILSFVSLSSDEVQIKTLENLAIGTDKVPRTTIKLKDIATVQIEEKSIQKYFRINGKNAVNVRIYSYDDVNIIQLSRTIRKRIAELSHQNSSNYSLILNHDSSVFLQKEISKNYRRTIIAIVILILFIVIVYRDLRHVATLLLSLIVNLALTIILVWAFKLVIHVYTLAGIAIAFGFMIDHAIIMLDYYRQYKNRKVIAVLIAASMATISSLMLFFFLPEEMRNNFLDFSKLLIFALLTSLVTNFFFTVNILHLFTNRYPTSNSKYSKLTWHFEARKRYLNVINFCANHRKKLVFSLILVFGIPLFMLPERIENNWLYNEYLGSDFYQQKVAPRVNSILGGTLKLFYDNIYGNSTYRDLAQSKLYVHAELPVGNTIEQMNEIIKEVERYLESDLAIENYTTGIYSGQSASIEIVFKEKFESGPRPNELKAALISKALDWAGANWSIYGIGNSFNQYNSENVTAFRVKLMGYNYDQLEEQAELFAEKISSNKKIQNINIDDRSTYENKTRQEYTLKINSNIGNVSGASPQQIFHELSLRSKQFGFAGNITINDILFPVMVKSNGDDNFSIRDLLHENITMNKNSSLKLKDYGTLELLETSSTIVREDRQYLRIIGFEYFGNEELGEHYLEKKIKEFSFELPTGYTVKRDIKEFGSKNEVFGYGLIMLLILINYIICTMLFENFVQPFYIIALIPVAFIGLFLAFYLFKFPFDQGGYAAFVMLCGLVVNAGLFIIHDYNTLIKQKTTKINKKNQYLIRAIYNRGRTIMLTSTALICSLIPFLMDGSSEIFWFSMAVGTIGGLLFSFFALFIVLPVLLWKKQ